MRRLTQLESLQSLFSDLHKDVHGVRPRWQSVEQWQSVEWLENRIADLSVELEQVMANDAAVKERAIARFEELVEELVTNHGASDRETAIRWLMDAENVDGDYEYFCYKNNLPYGYFTETK